MGGQFALIVGNGEPPSRALFTACAREAELILCADGGANTASAYEYAPDYIVGDLDSVSRQGKANLAADRLILVDPEGDIATDGQKVLNHAVALGVTASRPPRFYGTAHRPSAGQFELAQDLCRSPCLADS